MSEKDKIRAGNYIGFGVLIMLTLILFVGAISLGSVDITLKEVFNSIFGRATDSVSSIIVKEIRLPMAITAALSGASLSVAGLILQTVFRNPLAGPSLLGVSSGASLGVALLMMGGIYSVNFSLLPSGSWMIVMGAAIIGALSVIALLLGFSSLVRNGVMLLIIGVMISYLASSIISLLSFSASGSSLKAFTIWGLGSFSDVTMSQIILFSACCLVLLILSFGCIKSLNAFLLGERYASSLGYNVKSIRALLLLLSGLLTAVITSYCGPIGFIGLIVPHIIRLLFGTSNHFIVLPGSILGGASVSLLCVILANGYFTENPLPINVVTPLIGVPVIIYIILRGNKMPYFK